MIGRLSGTVIDKQAPGLIVDCHGVGYEVETPMSTFLELPAEGEPVTLLTHLIVREDSHTLFGFATGAEKQLFRALLRISGVGAKMALAILSAMTPGDFQRCVEYEDATTLTKIPGVGKKTAERLIIEMPGSCRRALRARLQARRGEQVDRPARHGRAVGGRHH